MRSSRHVRATLVVAAVGVAVGLAVPARAQATLTLREAIEAAWAAHPDLRVAAADVEAAAAGEMAARARVPEGPTLELSAVRAVESGGGRSWTAGLEQPLFLPGEAAASRRAASAESRSARAAHAWTRHALAAETTLAVARLAASRRSALAAADLAGLLERLAATASERLAAGDVSEYERNRIELETAVALAEVEALRAEEAEALAELGALIGPGLAAAELLDPPAPLTDAQVEQLERAGAAARDDVAAADARAEAEASRRDAAVSRRFRPSVHVEVESERSTLHGDDFRGLPFPGDGLEVVDEGEAVTLGVGFALPSRAVRRAEIVAAGTAQARAEAERDALARGASAEVARLAARARALARAHALIEPVGATAAANLATVEQAHALGRLPLSELLLERERLLRARLERERIVAALTEAHVRLAAAAGDLGPYLGHAGARGGETGP